MNIEGIPFLSMSAVKDRDKTRWLALYEEDAVVEDPVGGFELWDPTGEGQRGHQAISRFYDTFCAMQESLDFEVVYHVPCGDEVACFVKLTIVMKDGSINHQQMITLYRISPRGKIASLRAFWN